MVVFRPRPGERLPLVPRPPLRRPPQRRRHTFSKWNEVRAHLGGGEAVLCGVSTDCCVLMTALAAVDDGVPIRVIADACAAKTRHAHDAGAVGERR